MESISAIERYVTSLLVERFSYGPVPGPMKLEDKGSGSHVLYMHGGELWVQWGVQQFFTYLVCTVRDHSSHIRNSLIWVKTSKSGHIQGGIQFKLRFKLDTTQNFRNELSERIRAPHAN